MVDRSFKVVFMGDGAVGKTTLINRYTAGVFTESTAMTIGVDFRVKKIKIQENLVSLQLWDFMGEERFRAILPIYVAGADGGIFMFDLTRYDTFKNIENWTEVLKECVDDQTKPLPMILVGGKADLALIKSVESFWGKKLAEDNPFFISYIECSSKTGANVDLIFETIAKEMLRRENLL